MTTNKSVIALMAAVVAGGGWLFAETPTVSRVNDQSSASLETLSDNGEWAVGYGKSIIEEIGYSFPKLYNVKTKVTTPLYKNGETEKIAEMMACDVTDDGSIVIGQYDSRPALWHAATSEWTILPVKAQGFNGGKGTHITPDGKYAIGTVTNPNWNETLVYWDLTGEQPVDITPDNLPLPISMEGVLQQYQQIRSCDLSADGSKFIGLVAFSYAGELWSFVYDMETKSWKGIGVDVTETENGYSFSYTDPGYYMIEGGKFRPESNEIYGSAYLEGDIDGVYMYDMDTRKLSIVEDSSDKMFGGVDKYGLIYASTPAQNPSRDWLVKYGKYWYDFKILASQLWNLDWMNDITKDEWGSSGSFVSVSNDGLSLLSNDYTNAPYDSYVIELDENLSELCPKVNLLANYQVSPVNNAAFAILRQVQVLFDRDIEIVGNPINAVTMTDGEGTNANSVNVVVDPGNSKMLTVTFRNKRLEVGRTYTLTIPEGVVGVAGDPERLNPEIKVNYKGRPQAPVSPVTISPEDGIELERINASSNPIMISFDAEISSVAENAGAMYLYLVNEDGSKERISQLSGSITGNILSIYPVMEQRLAKGSEYEIVIEKNVVADISGADPNEEIVLHYTGSFVPGGDPRKPFEDNFNDGITLDKWMLYEGDAQQPASEPASWGFDAENYPWWVARDGNESTDMAAVSHSMYEPAGKSDDWMVTNQIYIADDSAVLSFKSQGYRKDVEDKLKVIVYSTEDVYTALTKSIVDNMRYYGDVVYDEVQNPGANEETLAGDWTENVIKLDKYAGKYIYIAFLNENRNKSAVFVDDVMVSIDVDYVLANLTQESALAQDGVTVKGILSVESLTETYKGYELTLEDAEGNVVSTVADPNAELKLGDEISFTFPEALPTAIGKVVKYVIGLKLGDNVTDRLSYTVKNLAVETTKRVVIEEFTGQGCPNCPLGHAALDIIAKDFGDKVIPLAIHTYTGDNFSTPQAVQLTSFLGLTAAPTARVNRLPVSSPMEIVNDKYYYKDNGVWYDFVVSELSEYADADVNITSAEFDGEKYNVSVDVTYALDMDNRNVNIFTVITEDGLLGVQDNNRATVEDPALGDWGKGGIYGSNPVLYTYHDVVRTYEGTTCNGTGGYIPASVVGGQAYTANITVADNKRISNPDNTAVTVMLIDANTGLVVNANRARIQTSGVDSINADNGSSVEVVNGNLVVRSESYTIAEVYAVDGMKIAAAAGQGEFVADLNGYRGTVLVTLKNDNGSKTIKLLAR